MQFYKNSTHWPYFASRWSWKQAYFLTVQAVLYIEIKQISFSGDAKPLTKPMLGYHWEQIPSKILIKIQDFSFKKMCLKLLSVKWRPFCPGVDELSLQVISRCAHTDEASIFLQLPYLIGQWGFDARVGI